MCSEAYILSTERAGMISLPDWMRTKVEDMIRISQVLGETSFIADSPSLHLL